MVEPRDSHVALPRERKFYASVESTFGTRIQPAGADAIRLLSGVTGSPVPNRIERVDNRQTRSIESQITGSTPPIEWSAEGYLIPSGAAGTAPDIGAIMKAAFGVETIVGGTSVASTPSDVQAALGSLTITDAISDIMMESIAGCFVEEFTLRGAAGDPVQYAATGLGASHVLTGRTTLATTPVSTSFDVDVPENIEIGSRGQFLEPSDGTTVIDDNSGSGFTVTNKVGATITVNVAPTGVTSGDVWAPFAPTESILSWSRCSRGR